MHENRLGRESSPYLRQHMHNPVDWHAWGAEAFERAKAEDKPILLSVGYAACHWCHVMERESFENAETAALMNQLFINIKVDREERPDVDNVYQSAVQLLRQSGGWPLTAFLLPDGRCYYAGTYFPDTPRYGMPSFTQVLEQLSRAYRERRADVEKSAAGLGEGLARIYDVGGKDLIGPEAVVEAAEFLLGRVDTTHGGFGSKPKFPSPSNLWTLWRHGVAGSGATSDACRDAVLFTLNKMALGGIYDQLGGGFHRYSTDEEWLAPHFEKMLYDNAQLVPLYLDAWRATRDPDFLRVATETLEYLCRDMLSPEGAFFGTTDADSEGEEGRYFVWSPRGVAAIVQDEAESTAFCAYYDVSNAGNWEGHSILRVTRGAAEVAAELGISEIELALRLQSARTTLLAARSLRIVPLRDEKILAAWNGLTITAFVDAWWATGDEQWLSVAQRAAGAVLNLLVREGQLQHSACRHPDGTLDVRGPGLLDDHGALGEALVRLFEADGNLRWLNAALALAIDLQGGFSDSTTGSWYQSRAGVDLIVRPRDMHDSAVPSGSALAAGFLARLAVHLPEARWTELCEGTIRAHQKQLESNPFGTGHLLGVVDGYHRGFTEIVIGGHGPARDALWFAAGQLPILDKVVLRLESLAPDHPAAGGRGASDGTAWVCRGHACSLPVHTPAELVRVLE